MFGSAKRLVMRVAETILDLDNTTQPVAQIKMFEDYLKKFEFNTDTDDIKKFLGVLKKKHLVDDIVVSSMNGSSIASVNGSAVSQAVSGAALFNYIQSEIPGSQTVLIKSEENSNWNILFSLNKKLYLVKASSDMSPIELKALAKEIESFLDERQIS